MSRSLLTFSLLALLPSVSLASVTAGAGFSNTAVAAAPGGAFPGGMDLLPSGHVAIFDGSAVVEVDPADGSVLGTLYTPPGFVFGSFVKTDPTGSFLLFGESLLHTITKIPLDGSPTSVVATVSNNFDCAFDAVGAAYVTASPSGTTTQVYRLNLVNGATDQILEITGPTGPLAFDAMNNLYYAEASGTFPAPQGQQTIYRFAKAKVQTATGPGHLTESDGIAFVPGVTSVADLVFDDEGDLIASDSSEGTIREYDAGGNLSATIATEEPSKGITNLAFAAGNGPSVFGPFQDASGGTLVALSSDFFSYNDLNVLTPARPTLGTTPNSPIPAGPLTFEVDGGPANGTVLVLVCAQGLATEVAAYAGVTPLLVGVDHNTLVGAFVLALDGAGSVNIPANHGGAPAAIFVQGFAHDGAGFVGSTPPAAIVLK